MTKRDALTITGGAITTAVAVYLLVRGGTLALVGALPVLVVFLVLVRRFPALYLALAGLIITFPVLGNTALAHVGGASIYFRDLISVVGFAVAFLAARQLGQNVRAPIAAGVFLGMVLSAVIAGHFVFGPSAVVQARPFIEPLAATAFVLSLDLNLWRPRLFQMLRWLTIALLIIAAWNLATRGLGASNEYTIDQTTGEAVNTRILDATQSVVVAITAMVTLWRWSDNRTARGLLVWLSLFAVVILSQHRSVWAATLAGILIMLFMRGRGNALWHAVPIVLLLVMLAGPVLVTQAAQSALGSITTSIAELSAQRNTFTDRANTWDQLIKHTIDSGLLAVLVGEPFGTPYGRFVGEQYVEYAPHNWYVTVFLRTGIIGLALWLSLLIVMLKRSIRSSDRGMRLGLLALVVAFCVPYNLVVPLAVVFAMLLAPNEPTHHKPLRESEPERSALPQMS